MRRVIKPARVCECCGSVLVPAVEARFCDLCQRRIDEDVHIEVIIFWKGDELDTLDREFCSWDCFFEFLHNFPYNKSMVRFITLPSIGGTERNFGEELASFLKSLKKSTETSLVIPEKLEEVNPCEKSQGTTSKKSLKS